MKAYKGFKPNQDGTTAPADPRLPHDPWILPTREQVARALFASTYGDDVDWDEVTGVRHECYLDDADAVLALLSPWQRVEPGTTIKAGTRYRIEEASGSYECTTRSDWTVANRSRRVYIDPRTVPAEPDPRVKAAAQVEKIRPGDQVTAEFEGGSGALLSDRDILAALDACRIILDPFDPALVRTPEVAE